MSHVGIFQGQDWVGHATPLLEARMAEYEEGQIEFGILSIVKDPLLDLVAALAENLKVSVAVSARLDCLKPDWEDFALSKSNGFGMPSEGTSGEPDNGYSLTSIAINEAIIPEKAQQRVDTGGVADLMALKQELINAQLGIRMSIKEEQRSRDADEARSASRRHDYGPAVHAWVRMLAKKQLIEALLVSTG